MALTYGFYNSHDGDRRYTADQLSGLFEGLIHDGVYSTVGKAFSVSASGDSGTTNLLTVETGRGYFNGKWVVNDAPITLELAGTVPPVGTRWDALVFAVDNRDNGGRSIALQFIFGTASESNPVKPSMASGVSDLYYWPICYIKRSAGDGGKIPVGNGSYIVSAIGNDTLGEGQYTPFVTGIVQSMSVGEIWDQWNASIQEELSNLREAIGDISSGTILPNSVGTVALQERSVTVNKLAESQQRYIFENVSVTASMFSSSNDYSDYPYKGRIPLTNVKASMIPDIYFALEDIKAGIFAPVASTFDGGVYIYVTDSQKIRSGMTIPTIVCSGGVE